LVDRDARATAPENIWTSRVNFEFLGFAANCDLKSNTWLDKERDSTKKPLDKD